MDQVTAMIKDLFELQYRGDDSKPFNQAEMEEEWNTVTEEEMNELRVPIQKLIDKGWRKNCL